MIKSKFLLAIFFLSCLSLPAQNLSLADLNQDMALLNKEVQQLRLEVEQLRRENESLSKKLKATESSSVSTDVVRAQTSAMQTNVDAKMENMRKEIIEQVRREMENMAAQTNSAMEKLAGAVSSRPKAELPTTFADNFPKDGITYTVKSGDTLGKIAKENNSQTKWIQDANRIANPARDLRVGDVIFIPQK